MALNSKCFGASRLGSCAIRTSFGHSASFPSITMTDSHIVRSLCLALPLLLAVPVCAADPTVTNVRAAQKTGTTQVEIFYDMSGST